MLGFVAPDHLLAIANERAVYRLSSTTPGPAEPVAETAEALPQTTLLLPVGLHNQLSVMQRHDGTPRLRLPAAKQYRDRERRVERASRLLLRARHPHRDHGRWHVAAQSAELATGAFVPGTSHFLTSEDDGRTYRVTLEADGKLSSAVFAERGGTSVVTDVAGNVFIAGEQVWIYDRKGKPVGVLEIPERPGSLAFGGADRRTLFIAARTSLYSIRTKIPGR